ncbi:oxidoreductase [Arthroderma uncinatum]|uniref:oxidoreductase n=1 Tax=Arthroderma uncinatum TaxID=74035 RepID=UPI00144AD358|nr:oxidoreductase [Arthroderma uncinatum]KAF3483464.1 oxidoreductase [Arthroderma uncinatum]
MASTAQIQLPIFDISSTTAAVGKDVLEAATQYGFLYVNTASSCFSKEEIDSTFKMAKEFFDSPVEEKQEVEIKGDNTGWSAMHRETLDPENQERGDFKEAINFGEFKNHKASQPLPKSLIPHEADIDHFTTLCQKTCDRILTLLALGLGIPADWFSSRHDPSKGPSGCTLRFLHYPSIESPDTVGFKHGVDVRAGAHSDYGSITLLFQRDGQPGLEILTPSDEWAAVPVRPVGAEGGNTGVPPILVNIGDLLSHWTCGLLKSTVHQVVFPVDGQEGFGSGSDSALRDRYSIVYFCHPVHETELISVPSKLVDEQRERGLHGDDKGIVKVQTAREHLASRLAATYGGSTEDYHRE